MNRPSWINEDIWPNVCNYWTKSSGIPPSNVALFRRTHQHKKDKTWVDKRSEHVDREFTCKWDALTQEASSQGMPPPNVLEVWTDVAGVKKGQIYGLGMSLKK